jgi:hypothetical protein
MALKYKICAIKSCTVVVGVITNECHKCWSIIDFRNTSLHKGENMHKRRRMHRRSHPALHKD